MLDLYINTFVDKSSEIFKERLSSFYIDHNSLPKGVIWDALCNPTKISQHAAVELLKESNILYTFKDPFETGGVFKMLELNCNEIDYFVDNNEDDDLYFFNDSLQKTIVLTHEYINKDRRYCITATAL